MPVAVSVRRMAHGLVLGTFGGVAPDEHRLAQARGFLLDAARIGEDEVARGYEVVEVENLERVDDVGRSKPSNSSCAALRTRRFM